MALINVKTLREDLIARVVKFPESGMGYQMVILKQNHLVFPSPETFLSRFIVNSKYVFDFESLNNLPLIFDMENFLDLQSSTFSFDAITLLANSRYDISPTAVLPPYTYFSKPGDVFIRLSAFTDDGRILSDGSVLAGTYATTLNDMKVTPSGAAAVGRYALPDRVPACYVYRIIPPTDTPIFFGTVAPNYGLCGGGERCIFQKAARLEVPVCMKQFQTSKNEF